MGPPYLPLRRAMLACVLAAVVLAGGVLAARGARAEEAIVLDNGAVLRGVALKEDGDTIVFRLSGVGTDSRITIRRDRVAQRIVTVDPDRPYRTGAKPVALPVSPEEPVTETLVASASTSTTLPLPAPLPAEEPSAAEETFFERCARLAMLAFPHNPAARALLAALAMVVLLCLVALGARMADVQGMSLAVASVLAGLLGGFLALDALIPDVFLRADTAPWLVPTQLVAWVLAAAGLVRCGIPRALMLLAFVIFSGALVTFASGAVLVTI